MDINLKLQHTTVFMAFISNSLESMEVSSLASVGFSSNLLRMLYETPHQGASFIICGTGDEVKKMSGKKKNQRPIEIRGHERLKGYSSTAQLFCMSDKGL